LHRLRVKAFHEKLSPSTPVRIIRIFRARYRGDDDREGDLKNRPYYWIYGDVLPRESFSRD